MSVRNSVDVAIQLYGKPNQTALALQSLIRYSGHRIGKIFLTVENQQPHGKVDLDFVTSGISVPVEVHRPAFHIGWNRLGGRWRTWFRPYRLSCRYQYAWEQSNANYLFVLHNDMLFHGDLIGAYLERIGDALGIGQVGQCWNCPASKAGRCAPGKHHSYKPGRDEIVEMSRLFPSPRQKQIEAVLGHRAHAWPLPECRLNEFAALIDIAAARRIPKAPVFGAFGGIDTGSEWFWHVVRAGHRIEHLDFGPWATHAWATAPHGGKSANNNRALYRMAEDKALQILRREYGWPGGGGGGPVTGSPRDNNKHTAHARPLERV